MKSEDITGGLDLLGDWLDAKGHTEEAGLCTRAMDEINRLRAENARLQDRLADEEYVSKDLEEMFQNMRTEADALRAENARLREALKPILPDKVLDEEEYSLVCNFHLNAALMAYGEIHD